MEVSLKSLVRFAQCGLAALILVAGPLSAAVHAIDLLADIPVDTLITMGRLDNGLTYYIRHNGWPEKRVSLRLAVKAGSLVEEDDQQGLAHLVEHMAFNGSEHFKPGELVKYLESVGARFGPDLNAYTSFDETVYILDAPTDGDSLAERGILVLSDFAGRLSLLDSEIDKERGVVLEEWRLGQGADERIRRVQYPVLYDGSRYADRLPIGLPEIIEKTPAQRLRDFYRSWYRPELMAVVVVGDIDPQEMKAEIVKAFGSLPAGSGAPVPVYEVPLHEATRVSVAVDREARSSGVSVTFKRPKGEERTIGDYRRSLVERLFSSMLGDRLEERAHVPDAPFVRAFAYGSEMGKTVSTFNLYAQTADGDLARGLEALLVEAERARRHGFGEEELERARKSIVASYDQLLNDLDRIENRSYAREYVSHFLTGEPTPGLPAEHRIVTGLLDTITLEDISEFIVDALNAGSRVILASAPDKEGLNPPTEEQLLDAADRAAETDIEPWTDNVSGRELMDTPPAPGTVVGTETRPELGLTILTLSNGATVWLKPTDFSKDEILFSSFAFGGASMADSADYNEAINSASVVGEAGVGGFKPLELEKLLAGKIVSGRPYIGDYTHGLSGSCAPKDLETALQLLYLTFTEPTDRPEAFEVLKNTYRTSLANRSADPNAVFGDSVRSVNSRDHYTNRVLTIPDVDRLRLDTSIDFYRRAFGNAADFSFVIVGSFDPEAITPLVARYIGALPSYGRRTSEYVDRGFAFPQGIRRVDVRKGVEPKARTTITFFADTGLDEMEMHRARAATEILRIRLREILREDMGGTYGVSISTSNTLPKPGYGTMTVTFGCSPDNVKSLSDAVFKEIERLRKEGPSPEDLHTIQEQERRGLETAEKSNGYWLGSLRTVQMMGWDPERILKRRERIDLLTVDNVREAIVRYFPMDRFTVVTLLPESN